MFNATELFDDSGYARNDILPYIVPNASNEGGLNLGSPTNPWQKVYANQIVSTSGLQVQSGAQENLHTVTLVAGTVDVLNTGVTANTKIFLSRKTIGGTIGNLSYTVTPGVKYTITSSSATDTSVIDVLLVEAIP